MTREMRFGEDAGNEIIKAVRETYRRMRNVEPHRGRWFNRPQPTTCDLYHNFSIEGNPSGGTCVLNIVDTRPTPDVEYTITINYDDTAAEITTLIETATGWTGSNVDFFVINGPLPNNEVSIKFPVDVWAYVPIPTTVSGYTTNAHDLTRNGPLIPHTRITTCCR